MTEMTRYARTELLRDAGYRALEAETQVEAGDRSGRTDRRVNPDRHIHVDFA